jgi:hypothetical protein
MTERDQVNKILISLEYGDLINETDEDIIGLVNELWELSENECIYMTDVLDFLRGL